MDCEFRSKEYKKASTKYSCFIINLMDIEVTAEYEIEEIIDEKFLKGKPYYLIKWKGYPKSQSTWEPIDNMERSLPYLIEWKKQKIRDDRKTNKKPVEQVHPTGDMKFQLSGFEQRRAKRKNNKKIQKAALLIIQVEDDDVSLFKIPSKKPKKTKEQSMPNEVQVISLLEDEENPKYSPKINFPSKHLTSEAHPRNPAVLIEQASNSSASVSTRPQTISQKSQQKHQETPISRESHEQAVAWKGQTCQPVIENVLSLDQDSIIKVQCVITSEGNRYFQLELCDGNIGLIGPRKMKKMHPQILCDFYEEILKDDPRLYPKSEAQEKKVAK